MFDTRKSGSADKARGHLGTEILNKASTVLHGIHRKIQGGKNGIRAELYKKPKEGVEP